MAFGKFAVYLIEMALGISRQLFLLQMIGRGPDGLQTRSQCEERGSSRLHIAHHIATRGAGCEVIVKREQFSRLQPTLAVTVEKLC